MKSLRRRSPYREALGSILIVCEGTKTEPEYFRHLGSLHRTVLRMDIRPAGVDPKALVERAVEIMKAAEMDAQRKGDSHLSYDSVWCVFDVDDHRRLSDAKQQALANGIKLAISNPCFELWFLLHFQDHMSYIHRDKLSKLLCTKHLPSYRKGAPVEELEPRYQSAVARASQLNKWQVEQGRKGGNPSTDVYLLTEEIRAFGSKATARQN
jgi:hypothetical protein